MAPQTGDIVGDGWRLEEVIGTGGTALVFGATHADGRRAAVKVLRPELAPQMALVARFFGEGEIATLVDHPGVVRRFAEGVSAGGVPYLVVDRLDGETLAELIARRGALPLSEGAAICQAVLDVLACAHARGIVHRDVKPENVFVTDLGLVKLIDFGIARDSRRMHVSQTQDQVIFGTPAFMPPEQARASWNEVDARSDLWALAATFYRAVTGRYLRSSASLIEDLADATLPLPPLAQLAPELPRPILGWLDRALAHDRAQRFRDAVDMGAALDEAQSAVAWGASQPPARPSRSSLRVSSRRGWRAERLASIAALVAVVAAGIVWTAILLDSTRAPAMSATLSPPAAPMVMPRAAPVAAPLDTTPPAEAGLAVDADLSVPVETLPLAPWAPAPPLRSVRD